MSAPTAPPAHRRAATAEDAAALGTALEVQHVLRLDDAAALVDPRGLAFERLEWLGDSLLDHITAHHRFLSRVRGDRCCATRSHSDLVSDSALAGRADACGLLSLLDWRPSPARQADLVEACIAAAWRVGGWPDAVAAAAVLVHPEIGRDGETFRRGTNPEVGEPDCASAPFRRLAELGSHILEAAASTCLFATQAGDEGTLTAQRRPLLSARRLLHRSGVPGTDRRPGPGSACHEPAHEAHALDHVQARVGLAQLRAGADRALAEARTAIGI